MTRRILYLASLLLLLPELVCGQQRLTLDQAVQQGLVNNYQVLVSKNETQRALQNISYGNAGFLPEVIAAGSVDRAFYDAKVKVVGGSELNNNNAEANISSAALKAEWVLFDGAGMFAEYEKLKSLWKIADLETRITMETVVQEIIVVYCNIIRQQDMLEATSQQLISSNLRYKIANEKYATGMGSEQEKLQANVALKADSTAFILQKADLIKAKIALNRLLAAEAGTTFVTEDSIPLMQVPTVDVLKTKSQELNNLIKINTEFLMLSQIEERSLKSGNFPRIALTGSYGYWETNTEASFIKYNRYFGPQIGFNIGFKLFDGLRLSQSVKNAKVDIENKQLLLKDVQLYISVLITQTWLDYQSQLQTVMLGRERKGLAQKNADIALTAYQAGLISSVELRIAQDDHFKASADLVNAIYNTKVKETELLSISGMLLK